MQNSLVTTSQKEQKTLGGIPDELLLLIFSLLTVEELEAASMVCQQWWRVINDRSLWVQHVQLLDQRIAAAILARHSRYFPTATNQGGQFETFRLDPTARGGVNFFPDIVTPRASNERRDQQLILLSGNDAISRSAAGPRFYEHLHDIEAQLSSTGSYSRLRNFFHIIRQSICSIPIYYRNCAPRALIQMLCALSLLKAGVCFYRGLYSQGLFILLINCIVVPLLFSTVGGFLDQCVNRNLLHQEFNRFQALERYNELVQSTQNNREESQEFDELEQMEQGNTSSTASFQHH